MNGYVPNIRPITDLKRTSEISEYCRKAEEPVFITKNGSPELVIMSVETYEREMFQKDVYLKLAQAESEFESGAPTVRHNEFLKKVRETLSEGL
jgi:prevent-host-death family protein